MDVPARYLPCLVAGLAYQIASKKPDSMAIAPALKQVYEETPIGHQNNLLVMAPGGYNNL